jgi:hypothetical protein
MNLIDPMAIVETPEKYVHTKYVLFATELYDCDYRPISDFVESSTFNIHGIKKITIIFKKKSMRWERL